MIFFVAWALFWGVVMLRMSRAKLGLERRLFVVAGVFQFAAAILFFAVWLSAP